MRRWMYVWLLPLLWCSGSGLSFLFHGDEYGIWAIGSLPAVVLAVRLFDLGDTREFLLSVLLVGGLLMTAIGFLMAWLRVPPLLAGLSFGISGFCIWIVLLLIDQRMPIRTSEHVVVSYYLLAWNLALYVTVLISLAATAIMRSYGRRSEDRTTEAEPERR